MLWQSCQNTTRVQGRGSIVECSFCRHQCLTGARSCPRCGAPLGVPAPALHHPTPEVEGDHTIARRQKGPEPTGRTGSLRTLSAVAVAQRPVVTPRQPALADAATLGQRFGAVLLDVLLLTMVSLAAQFVTGFVVPRPSNPWALVAYIRAMTIVVLTVSVVALAYFTVGNHLSQTLGKRLVGTCVVHYRTRERLGWGPSFVRAIMLFVLALPAGLGFFSVLGAERRGWHDLAANSLVVKAPERPRPQV